MPAEQPPQPRKRPRQQRSTMLVAAIQEACRQILEREGADNLTTARIAEVAGVNISSLYQYFPNKEAVLVDVYDEIIGALLVRARERFEEIDRLAGQSLELTLAAIVDMEIAQLRELNRLAPDFYHRYQHRFDIHARIDELACSLDNPSWEAWFSRFLGRHRRHLRPGDTDLFSLFVRKTLRANLRWAALEQPGLLGSGEFREELLSMLLAYLQSPQEGRQPAA